jgi:hypothetical protein
MINKIVNSSRMVGENNCAQSISIKLLFLCIIESSLIIKSHLRYCRFLLKCTAVSSNACKD